MGYIQAVMGYRLIVIKQNIKVDHSGTFVDILDPSQLKFYRLKRIQQLDRAKGGCNLHTEAEC